MQVAIIGCGLIGNKRAKYLGSAKLIACADQDISRAKSLAAQYPNCEYYADWQLLLKKTRAQIVIVATVHAALAEITIAAINLGKHVLVEKPGGCNASEIEKIIEAQQKNSVCVHVGFNHRYHRAYRQAMKMLQDNVLGELYFIRARYGHGGRLGYEKEWRANPLLSGGGELIDQGVHLIDLARNLLGDFSDISGYTHTYHWDMPVDDNAFLLLKTPQQQVAFLHASCTEWKNTFAFEIMGRLGKLEINGLGGSYGVERLTWYQMLPEMGPPATSSWEFPMPDDSWQIEFELFLQEIAAKKTNASTLQAAHAALTIVDKIYRMQ